MKIDKKEVREAFCKIQGNLGNVPDKFCKWKKVENAQIVRKTLKNDYNPIFNFVSDADLRKNLAELRMCLDYQWTIYDLLKPTLTFERQHKLVIYQIVGAIYEGIMYEYLVAYTEREKNVIIDYLVKEKANNKGFGLGSMIELFYQTKLLTEDGKNYLFDIYSLRNTIHPRSFNSPKVT